MKVENVCIYGLNESIRAAKFPMSIDTTSCTDELTNGVKNLASVPMGTGHDNFLNGIIVQFDLTMPVKMSTELQRYHFIDFVSSQSQLHRITKFNLDNQYDRHVDSRIIDIIKSKVSEYNRLDALEKIQHSDVRQEAMKELYLEILMSNPCGFELTARMTTNYRQLKTIYWQRREHKLPDWREFCQWIETLPHFSELCLKGENKC